MLRWMARSTSPWMRVRVSAPPGAAFTSVFAFGRRRALRARRARRRRRCGRGARGNAPFEQRDDAIEPPFDALHALVEPREVDPAREVHVRQIRRHDVLHGLLHLERQAHRTVHRAAVLLGAHRLVGERVDAFLPLAEQLAPERHRIFDRVCHQAVTPAPARRRASSSYSTVLRIFPTAVFGSESRNSISCTISCLPSLSLRNSLISSIVNGSAPGLSAMNALGDCPRYSSATPMTHPSPTAAGATIAS